MKLNFNTLTNEGYLVFRQKDVPTRISNLIKTKLKLPQENEYIISFSRFVDFDPITHGEPITYFLSDMIDHIKREIVGENDVSHQVTYFFEDTSKISKFNKDQIILLCGIFHRLNLTSFLLPCVGYLMNVYSMSFEEIKILSKDDKYKITIFK